MNRTTAGLFVGLLLGLALALGGLGDMVIVGFVGAAGYLVAKVLEGELDLSEYLGSPDRPVGRRRRQP